MTFNALHWSVVALSAMCAVVHAPPRSPISPVLPVPKKGEVKRIDRNTVEVQGVRVRGTAYVSRSYKKSEASRYDMKITRKPSDGTQWHLVNSWFGLDLDYAWGDSGFAGETSAVPYRASQQAAQVKCELHQVDTREERVTFHNLDITRDEFGFGFLRVATPQTAITQDGVTVTLLVQNKETFVPNGCFNYNGPGDVVFCRVHLTPGKRGVLPASPLYRRYKMPVSLQVRAAAPLFTNAHSDESSTPEIHFTTPDKHATHLDTLTLTIRQVAELQTISLKFEVPIDRNKHD